MINIAELLIIYNSYTKEKRTDALYDSHAEGVVYPVDKIHQG